jgi:hypothetical protein
MVTKVWTLVPFKKDSVPFISLPVLGLRQSLTLSAISFLYGGGCLHYVPTFAASSP